MGLHTGEALPTDEGYVGIDVHRAARIAGVAHGGQVVISAATRQLLGSDVEVRDLGEHERPVRSRASLPTWQWRVSGRWRVFTARICPSPLLPLWVASVRWWRWLGYSNKTVCGSLR